MKAMLPEELDEQITSSVERRERTRYSAFEEFDDIRGECELTARQNGR